MLLPQWAEEEPLGVTRSQGDFLCVSRRGFCKSAQNLAQVGTNQPRVGTNDRQVVTNPPIARITPLLSMRVSVCRLEGGILMTAGLTRRGNG